MPMYDFECSCGYECEELVNPSETVICPNCKSTMQKIWRKSAPVLTVIIPSYPGCKKHKAGYTHTSYADQPATKIQSGYGGCVAPKD